MTPPHGPSGLDGYVTMQCLAGLPGCDDLACVCACHSASDQFDDEFAPHLAEQLRDPEVRAAYEAERRDDDEVIQFGHPRWGL